MFVHYISHKKKCIKAFKNAIRQEGMSILIKKKEFFELIEAFLDTLTYSDVLLRYENKIIQIDYLPLRRSWILHYKRHLLLNA